MPNSTAHEIILLGTPISEVPVEDQPAFHMLNFFWALTKLGIPVSARDIEDKILESNKQAFVYNQIIRDMQRHAQNADKTRNLYLKDPDSYEALNIFIPLINNLAVYEY